VKQDDHINTLQKYSFSSVRRARIEKIKPLLGTKHSGRECLKLEAIPDKIIHLSGRGRGIKQGVVIAS